LAQTNLYWDTNASGGLGGTTNWTTSGAFWTTNPLGSSTLVSGGWTNGAPWSNSTANNAIFSGTAGTVTLSSSSVYANTVTVNTTDYTFRNSSATSSRGVRTKNGLSLSNNVNLNLTAVVSTNDAGLVIEGLITNVVGATGTSVTITGTTANADSSIRIGLDSGADVYVPINVTTTGNGYACLSIAGNGVTNNIYGNITVSSGSRLTLMQNTNSSTRRLNILGNLSTVNTDLIIGETGAGGLVVLSGSNSFTGLTGSNSIGGDVVLNSGRLAYGSTNAFGTSTVQLKDGTTFGQTGSTGFASTNAADRTLYNNLSVSGNVTLGNPVLSGSGFTCYLAGNINLNAAARTITLSNTIFMSGVISNGGLTVNDTNGSTRSLNLSGNNTYTGATTTTNGGRLYVTGSISNSSSITAEAGGGLGYGSTNAFGTNIIVLKNGSTFGQIADMGSAEADRTLANSLRLDGNTTFGFGTYANFFSGSLDLTGGTRTIALTNSTTISGVISNGGLIVDASNVSATIKGANTYSGGTKLTAGTLIGDTTSLQGVITNNSQLIFNQATNGTFAGALSGTGSLVKTNVGTLTLTNESTYTGATSLSGGTLELNAASGSALKGTASLTVSANATLLLSASEQVSNTAALTLSGGTIQRGSGVNETFGALNLTANSFLNFGSVSESKLIQFGSLNMGAFTLGVTGFFDLNQLAYTASSLEDGASKLGSFTFDNSYQTAFSGSTFTITAIPEPSTMVAALGLAGLMLWTSRRRR